MTRLSYEVNLDSLVESEFKRGDVATQARPYCNHPCSGHRTKSVNESAKIVVYLVVYARLWPIVYGQSSSGLLRLGGYRRCAAMKVN